jgi:hypothetical protein
MHLCNIHYAEDAKGPAERHPECHRFPICNASMHSDLAGIRYRIRASHGPLTHASYGKIPLSSKEANDTVCHPKDASLSKPYSGSPLSSHPPLPCPINAIAAAASAAASAAVRSASRSPATSTVMVAAPSSPPAEMVESRRARSAAVGCG